MLVHPQKGLLMLTSSGAWTHSGANQIQSADGSVRLPLEIGFEADGARLLTDESGEIYVAGTDEENDRESPHLSAWIFKPEKRHCDENSF